MNIFEYCDKMFAIFETEAFACDSYVSLWIADPAPLPPSYPCPCPPPPLQCRSLGGGGEGGLSLGLLDTTTLGLGKRVVIFTQHVLLAGVAKHACRNFTSCTNFVLQLLENPS